MSGRDGDDSRRVLKPDLEAPCGPDHRRQHSRVGLRYETDLTDAEWAVIEHTDAEASALWPASALDDTGGPERHLLRF